MAVSCKQICCLLFATLVVSGFGINPGFGPGGQGSCAPAVHGEEVYDHDHADADAHVHSHHQCGHAHGHNHQHHHHHDHSDDGDAVVGERKLPEELAEEEDLRLFGFGFGAGSHHVHGYAHDHDHGGHWSSSELSGAGLWIRAMGCSLLVSLASLVCLILLPLIFMQGKPSKTVVDTLAVFGAGAMLGDAFLHQLPHAFGGGHSHSHDHHKDHDHDHDHLHFGHELSHSHSLKDLSVGLSVLAGILVFLLVEKLVRYVEDMSGGSSAWSHAHHHHHHKNSKKLKDDDDAHENIQVPSLDEKKRTASETSSEGQVLDKVSDESYNGEKQIEPAAVRKRNTTTATREDKPNLDAANDSDYTKSVIDKDVTHTSSSLVFGYLNLFSDGVHNFTDGMALGSAFLLYGSIGGWSRTIFLLAHELPQEIGDFGILVRSGFSASKALFFNFLSALLALAGTALALLWGQDPGQSSLIEGFTAGGFIYIAVAGVLAEMNNGSSALRSTAIQVTSLIMGMAVALLISLVE